MKHSLLAMTTALAGILALATAAEANNATVEDALKARPELSTFYSGLQSTGVLSELKEGQPYTVFAPTNEAFAQISQTQYPCFYSPDCKAQVAAILRRHIVPGEKHLSDINAQGGNEQGGVLSLFSIDNQHITASEPNKDSFTVDGHNVVSENQLLGGVLYKLDGVMADDRDMAQFVAPVVIHTAMIHEPGTDLPPHVPAGHVVTVTTTDTTKPIPY